jgi:hypothetical protein
MRPLVENTAEYNLLPYPKRPAQKIKRVLQKKSFDIPFYASRLPQHPPSLSGGDKMEGTPNLVIPTSALPHEGRGGHFYHSLSNMTGYPSRPIPVEKLPLLQGTHFLPGQKRFFRSAGASC